MKSSQSISRRGFFGAAGAAAASGLWARPKPAPSDVAIIGAGLAGLVCADSLAKAGIAAKIYEAESRAGGRCWSASLSGHRVERGGEFIDTGHKNLIRYARQFGLTLEDVTKEPGEVFYYFDGKRRPERDIVSELRGFVPAMRDDLRLLSKAPTADNHSPFDVALDRTSLAEYLETRGAGRLLYSALEQAYIAEYGLAIDRQSCLNFLLFMHADRRSKFTPFGIFSDERYHVVEGNQAIAHGLAQLLAQRIEYGRSLLRAARSASGRIELTFEGGLVRMHDAAVITLPFSVLRDVELHASLELPQQKIDAIQQLGYGTNAKMMVAFDAQPWKAAGCNGSSYSDLRNHQATWQTNPANASATSAVLTDYSGAARGAQLDPAGVQTEVHRFLGDLDAVLPGALAAASRDVQGNYNALLEHWPSHPRARGSYTCYLPGQFTSIAGNEGKRVNNLFFAGEHTNSFYEWQGFMEGAALSGIAAAAQIAGK